MNNAELGAGSLLHLHEAVPDRDNPGHDLDQLA